jgi:hypothetical protein
VFPPGLLGASALRVAKTRPDLPSQLVALQRPIELVSVRQKHLIVPQLFRSHRSSVVDTDFLLDRSSYTLLD